MASLETIPYEIFSEGRVVIYYFIGRLNPPHAGHEVALSRLLELAREDRSIPLILLGLYYLINLILNFIGLIVISYLIAKDKDLAPEFRLFPLELSDILSKILLNIPFASTLFNIIPVENKN